MITLESLRFLQSGQGADLLLWLKNADLSEVNTLKLLTDLRKRYLAEHAAAALEMARLRIKARDKYFGDTDHLFFTREALEQATHGAIGELVHSTFFREQAWIADLGCSIGADTANFASESQVIAVDLDPVRLAMAQANVPYNAHFIQANLTDSLPFRSMKAAFFDPARRSGAKRIFSVKDYSPPLDIIRSWEFESLLVKLSPGVDLAELSPYQGSVYFVSVDGELKEALLWTGESEGTRAVIISGDSGGWHANWLWPSGVDASPIREPHGYLYEPDPAIIRAGLLSELAERLNLNMYRLDETIAYLTADSLVQSPLVRVWIIDDWMPFNLKKLRAYLREHHVGRVTVKKRGSPLTPEELIAKLKLSGDGEERVIVLTRVLGQPAILICRAKALTS
jgi:hypothetical protein